MKRRFATVLAILLGVILAGVLFNRTWHREPSHQGRPLSFWFKQYCRYGAYAYPDQAGEARGDQALKALCAIGTNAVPFLVAECLSTNQDLPLATNLAGALGKLGFSGFIPKAQMGTAAYEALYQIKPPAYVLLPCLTAALGETNSPRHLYALYLLGVAGEGADAAVPYLGAALNNTNTFEPYYAALAIRRIGPLARALIPNLVEILERPQSAAALRSYAASALTRMGTNAASAAPALLATLTDSSIQNRQAAATALNEIGYDHRSLLAEMVKQLDGPDEAGRYAMARLILDLEPTNLAAMTAMIGFVQADSGWRATAIQELGKLGSAATPAIPVLRHALTSKELPIREAASNALDRIEASGGANRSRTK